MCAKHRNILPTVVHEVIHLALLCTPFSFHAEKNKEYYQYTMYNCSQAAQEKKAIKPPNKLSMDKTPH